MSGPGEQVPGGTGPGQPSEEELRAAYEAELSRITATDMIAQTTVSLLNIAAHRLGPPSSPSPGAQSPPGEDAGRDLEQARDAIDAAGALIAILERRIPGEVGPLRDALSRLQMAYAGEVGSGAGEAAPPGGAATGGEGGEGGEGGPPPPQGGPPGGQQEGQPKPGPAESSGRLWVPGR
ncbi:MAG: hypothetical protein ACLQBB_08310 [Solirubrobacteraceae bacterium]